MDTIARTTSTRWSRIAAVSRAGFAATWGRGTWPVGPLVMHGSLAALLCGLVRDTLPPYGYAVFALALAGATLALPLLGEFGMLLRADPSAEWIEAQPVARSELRTARIALILVSIFALSASALLPAALFAPDGVGWGARAALVGAGLLQSVVIAAALLALQSALGERVEALLVLVQTVLVAFVVTGIVIVPRVLPYLRGWDAPDDLPALARAVPSAWFAAVVLPATEHGLELGLAAGALLLAVAVLALAPLPPPTVPRRTRTWMALLLAPVRRLATRVWVGPRARGPFDLVWDALPLEREFVLRTYPMLGIPLAFLFVGAADERGSDRQALLSLLLFTPPIYLPILLAHVPATNSPEARWILETAPVSAADVHAGALKAVALRFLLPLYVVLFALAALYVGPHFALRIGLPAAIVGLIVLRQVFPMFARDLPLSISAREVQVPMDWTGPFLVVAVVLVLVSLAAWAWLTTIWASLAVCAVLLAVDRAMERREQNLFDFAQ
jgi:hypothetical protein